MKPSSSFLRLLEIEDQKSAGLNRVAPQDLPTIPSVPVAPQNSVPTKPILPAVTSVPVPTAAPAVTRESRSERSRQRLKQRQLNVAFDAELADQLSTYAYQNRRSIADVLHEAVWTFLRHNWIPTAPSDTSDGREVASLGELQSQPDLAPREHPLIFDDEDDDWRQVVEIYQRATGNQYREGDRDFLAQVQKYGRKVVILGILTGRARNPKRIGSMKYFYNNVLEAAALQPDRIDELLAYNWEMFQRRY